MTQSIKMLSGASLPLLLLLLATVNLGPMLCAVDESAPDLSVFQLRPVGARVANRRSEKARLDAPISDYAPAAIKLRGSLMSNSPKVRCSAYAHLLKLVRRVKAGETNFMDLKLDTLMALATVAEAERELYGRLYVEYQPEVLQEVFRETIEQLERLHIQTSASKDTWLELIDCALNSPTDQLNLAHFLEKPHRAAQIESYLAFKGPLISQPAGPQPADAPSFFNEEEIKHARTKVERFDDAALKQLRVDLRNRKPTKTAPAAKKPKRVTWADEQDAPAKNNQLAIDLTAPINDLVESQLTASERGDLELVDNSLDVLDFLKRWLEVLETRPRERLRKKNKLTVDAAIDFLNHWHALTKLADSGELEGSLVERVRAYQADDNNKRVFARMERIVDNFTLVVEAMLKMKSAGNRYSSMEELNKVYDYVIKLLSEVDELVDIYDITRAVLNSRKREHQEFKAVHKFIESDSW